MQILSWLGRGAARAFALLGMIAWFVATAAATVATFSVVDSGDVGADLGQKVALGIGVPLMAIGAPLVLRASGRWGSFFAALACGGLLCLVGAGVLRTLTTAPVLVVFVLGAFAVTTLIAALIPRSFLGVAGVIATVLLGLLFLAPQQLHMASAPNEQAGAPVSEEPADTQTAPAPPSATIGSSSPSPSDNGTGTAPAQGARAATPAPRASDFVMEELRFNKPEKMRINQAYVVEAQIGAPMEQQLGTDGDVQHRDVAVPGTRLVQVELVANDFDVVKLHTVDEQLVAPGSTGIWSWRVTPRHAGGDQALLLQVYGVLRANGQEGRVLVRTYRETIPIEVTTGDQLQMLARAFLQRWDLIAGVFGAIGGIWVFFSNVVKFFRRKEPAQAAA